MENRKNLPSVVDQNSTRVGAPIASLKKIAINIGAISVAAACAAAIASPYIPNFKFDNKAAATIAPTPDSTSDFEDINATTSRIALQVLKCISAATSEEEQMQCALTANAAAQAVGLDLKSVVEMITDYTSPGLELAGAAPEVQVVVVEKPVKVVETELRPVKVVEKEYVQVPGQTQRKVVQKPVLHFVEPNNLVLTLGALATVAGTAERAGLFDGNLADMDLAAVVADGLDAEDNDMPSSP